MSTIYYPLVKEAYIKNAEEAGYDPMFLQGYFSQAEALSNYYEAGIEKAAAVANDPMYRIKLASEAYVAILNKFAEMGNEKQAEGFQDQLDRLLQQLGAGAGKYIGQPDAGKGLGGTLAGAGVGTLIGILLSSLFGIPMPAAMALGASLGGGLGYGYGSGGLGKMWDQITGKGQPARLDQAGTQDQPATVDPQTQQMNADNQAAVQSEQNAGNMLAHDSRVNAHEGGTDTIMQQNAANSRPPLPSLIRAQNQTYDTLVNSGNTKPNRFPPFPQQGPVDNISHGLDMRVADQVKEKMLAGNRNKALLYKNINPNFVDPLSSTSNVLGDTLSGTVQSIGSGTKAIGQGVVDTGKAVGQGAVKTYQGATTGLGNSLTPMFDDVKGRNLQYIMGKQPGFGGK